MDKKQEHKEKIKKRRAEQLKREPSVAIYLPPEFFLWRNKHPKYKKVTQ